ncbi:YcgL domain-containing protein [Reinekea sp.]|jgi:uncharacterized protein YcgL (UPF0745 family)|uniref:YcgL domain-containing protein n=1 Tax=Reinekea sp. TaxID=1970455 RepID=UPI002A837F8F|nr:YcgL domain-containing protein [Reinekea sp.]
MSREIVRIYRSSRDAGAYLYVAKKTRFEDLPDGLKKIFGRPIVVTDMLLTADKKLARADAGKVLAQIAEQGFYLQMPPPKEDYLLDFHKDKDR